jgi:O-antigen ligase
MRGRALPTVLAMIAEYFPAGAGLGGFDPLFRMHEPFALLKTTYFNHAHNDWLEVVLDAGLPGLLVSVAALAWWLVGTIRAWRGGAVVARLGSAMLLLIMLASVIDYPARTPMMMATVVIAAVWLSRPRPAAQLYHR